MPAIKMNRVEILELMKILPEDHWMNERLTNALVKLNNDSQISEKFRNKEDSYRSESKLRKFKNLVMERSLLGMIKPEKCAWELYGNFCDKDAEDTFGYQLCSEHIEERCTKCGDQAVHGCPEELQFVCGESLCTDCHHRSERVYRKN